MTIPRLRSIKIQNFRSILNSAISLPESGLVGVKGTNAHSRGSSGSGKTSFVLGANYALGCANFPATQLQSWLTEVPLQVSLGLSINGQEVELKRGKSTSLTTDTETLKGATAVDQRLETLLGLSSDLLQSLTYRPQKRGSAFLGMDDASKKDFLGQVIPLLNKFESEGESASEKVKELVGKTQEAEARFSILSSQVELAKQEILELQPVVEDFAVTIWSVKLRKAQEELEVLKQNTQLAKLNLENTQKQLSSLQDQLYSIKPQKAVELEEAIRLIQAKKLGLSPVDDAKLQARLTECLKRLKTAKDQDQVKKQQFDDKTIELHSKESSLKAQISQRPNLEKKQQDLLKDIAHLETGSCPTCLRQWSTDQLEKKKKEKTEELKNVIQKMDSLSSLEEELAKVIFEIQSLPKFESSPIIDKLSEMALGLKEEIDNLRRKAENELKEKELDKSYKLAQIKAELQSILDSARKDILEEIKKVSENVKTHQNQVDNASADQAEAERKVFIIEKELQENKNERKRLEEAQAKAQARLQNLEEQAAQANTELSNAKRAANAELDFAALVGREGFLGAIFDEILAEIANETNSILGLIPNTSRVVIKFCSETVTAKGKVKRTIKPKVSVDGHDSIPMDAALSGGMYSSAELAIDLAVLEVLTRRTGVTPGWLFLDEPFEGLGKAEKEAWIEVLKKYAKNRLVVVIDHASETKEAFDVFVNAIFTDGVTTITQESLHAI